MAWTWHVLQICSAVGVPAEDRRPARSRCVAPAAEAATAGGGGRGARARGGGLPARWRIWQGGHQGGCEGPQAVAQAGKVKAEGGGGTGGRGGKGGRGGTGRSHRGRVLLGAWGGGEPGSVPCQPRAAGARAGARAHAGRVGGEKGRARGGPRQAVGGGLWRRRRRQRRQRRREGRRGASARAIEALAAQSGYEVAAQRGEGADDHGDDDDFGKFLEMQFVYKSPKGELHACLVGPRDFPYLGITQAHSYSPAARR